jgi:hypothetical protein
LLDWADEDARIERIVEQRLVERFESESFRWRFRLILIETGMMALLVLAAGLALEQPATMVARASALIAVSCFVTGLLLLFLSAGTAKLISYARSRRQR